jgi:hypothetical protein
MTGACGPIWTREEPTFAAISQAKHVIKTTMTRTGIDREIDNQTSALTVSANSHSSQNGKKIESPKGEARPWDKIRENA